MAPRLTDEQRAGLKLLGLAALLAVSALALGCVLAWAMLHAFPF